MLQLQPSTKLKRSLRRNTARWLRAVRLPLCALAFAALAANAGTPPAASTTGVTPAPAASIVTLQAINVTGVVPGPG
jgi:hypothetical protein